MKESILVSIKKVLGIIEAYEQFDADIIMHINTVFSILNQLGAGPIFRITGSSETWDEYISDEKNLDLIKTYMYMRVKQIFDPPTIGIVNESLNNTIRELEWRISVEVDPREEVVQN